MTKWDYFLFGLQFGFSVLGLWALFFGEITVWPLKKPLKQYQGLFFVIVTLFMYMGLQALLRMVD
ncbi:hypothetical protein [Limosilactobacillus reuteri]|uniref:hypothetical protein n=1 Tax=Limosilactobacillus reuteri TaxID=1598 RepID=UPI0015DEE9CB|nr:hypothetical protein [Limosilactobacillus reuteri]QLL75813.1 hypothetical protein GTO86_04190 [Limosilactobacillus reuteri]